MMPPPTSPNLNFINIISQYLHEIDPNYQINHLNNHIRRLHFDTMSDLEHPSRTHPSSNPASNITSNTNPGNYHIRDQFLPMEIRNIHPHIAQSHTEPSRTEIGRTEIGRTDPATSYMLHEYGLPDSSDQELHSDQDHDQQDQEEPVISFQDYFRRPPIHTRLSHIRYRPSRSPHHHHGGLNPISLTRQNAIRRKQYFRSHRLLDLDDSSGNQKEKVLLFSNVCTKFLRLYNRFLKRVKESHSVSAEECPLFDCYVNHYNERISVNDLSECLNQILHDNINNLNPAGSLPTDQFSNKRRLNDLDKDLEILKRQKVDDFTSNPVVHDTTSKSAHNQVDHSVKKTTNPQLISPELLDHNPYLTPDSSFDIVTNDFHINFILTEGRPHGDSPLNYNLTALPPMSSSIPLNYVKVLRSFAAYLVPNYFSLKDEHLVQKFQLFDRISNHLGAHDDSMSITTTLIHNTLLETPFKFNIDHGELIDFVHNDLRFLNLENKFSLLNHKNCKLSRLDRDKLYLQVIKWLNLSPFKLIINRFLLKLMAPAKIRPRPGSQFASHLSNFYKVYSLLKLLNKFNADSRINDDSHKDSKTAKELTKLVEQGDRLNNSFRKSLPEGTLQDLKPANLELKLMRLIINYISCTQPSVPDASSSSGAAHSPCLINLKLNFSLFTLRVQLLSFINQLIEYVFTRLNNVIELSRYKKMYHKLNQKFAKSNSSHELYLINSLNKKTGVWELNNTQILTTPESKPSNSRKLYTHRYNDLFSFNRDSSGSDLSEDDDWDDDSYEEGDDETFEDDLGDDDGADESEEEEDVEEQEGMEDFFNIGIGSYRRDHRNDNSMENDEEGQEEEEEEEENELSDEVRVINNVARTFSLRIGIDGNEANDRSNVDVTQSTGPGFHSSRDKWTTFDDANEFTYDDYDNCLIAKPTRNNTNKYSSGGGSQIYSIL